MSFDKFLEAVRNGNTCKFEIAYQPEYINQKDENGNSAFQLAVMNANFDTMKSLIRLGCDLDCTPKNIQKLVDSIQTDDEKIREKIENTIKKISIAKLMELTCDENCDHAFCLTSFCFNEFKEGELVDKGRFGKVSKVQASRSHNFFAIKKISWKPIQNDDQSVNKDAKYVENDINNLYLKLRHERIVKYYGAFIDRPKMFILMEYVSGGSLEHLIDNIPNELPIPKVWKYTKHILEALQFLHEQDIIHRDIKPGNILRDEYDNCKLTDLGFSRLLRTIERCTNQEKSKRGKTLQANTKVGTSNYMTPEMIKGLPYRTECDIWSLGATIFHMYFGKPPYYGEKQNAVFMKIGRDEKPSYLDRKNKDDKIISLLNDTFIIDQKKRPTATDLLQNYFKGKKF